MAVRNTVTQWPVPTVKQSYETDLRTPTDPTSSTVEFGLTLVDDVDGPTAWSAGTWLGAWTSGLATAITPTIGIAGSGATLTGLASGFEFWVWARVTLAGEIWAEPVGAIRVP